MTLLSVDFTSSAAIVDEDFFVTMFVNVVILRKKLTKLSEDGQWVWDHTIEFARWQHPAMGQRATLLCLALLVDIV